jgi:Protein of unknown function (DUF2510)
MSDVYAAAAGWYPEPDGTVGQRWWDGARWTEYATPLAAPPVAPEFPQYDAAVRPRVSEGTPVDTVWIWLIVVLPIVALIPFFLLDFEGYLVESMTDPMAQVRMYLDPMYLASVLLGWGAYGASVVFAYLDVRALRQLGYARQFHWAWTFLSPLVYVIGRSVVVKRQAGRGSAPMWVAIALNVALFVGTFVWIGVITANVVGAAMSSYPGI